MQGVTFGRKWHITTYAEYRAAMDSLADAEFIAEMSNRYARKEKAEIDRQREQVIEQAKEAGIMKEVR